MTIATYAELLTEISAYLDRGTDLDARIPTFIRLTEARLNRLLEDPDMELISTSTATGEYTALPADYGSMVSISTGNGPLTAVGSVEFAGYDRTVTGIPRNYAIVDGSVSFAPFNSTTPITIIYRRTIPALAAANQTNWLLTRAPDVYLYGALVQASAFLVDETQVALWKSAYDEAIQELRMDGDRRKWGAGPIAPRIRRT
jgi:hypothetical protein